MTARDIRNSCSRRHRQEETSFNFVILTLDKSRHVELYDTRNPAPRASKRARLVAMYNSYIVSYRVTSEAVSFLSEVVDQI